jgi:hypothetical protein
MYLRICGSFKNWFSKPQTRKLKKCGQQIANLQVCKFADLRFAELTCGPPTFGC